MWLVRAPCQQQRLVSCLWHPAEAELLYGIEGDDDPAASLAVVPQGACIGNSCTAFHGQLSMDSGWLVRTIIVGDSSGLETTVPANKS